jgi:hypothetical protein
MENIENGGQQMILQSKETTPIKMVVEYICPVMNIISKGEVDLKSIDDISRECYIKLIASVSCKFCKDPHEILIY